MSFVPYTPTEEVTMFFPIQFRFVAALLVSALFGTGVSFAQPSRSQQRLNALQQQNALVQQQNAVQSALQQTAVLLQSAAYQTNGVPQLNFAPQENSLQMAIQQTNDLLQSSYRRNSSLSQLALQQLNTLQTVLQQSIYLQGTVAGSVSPTGAQLSPFQVQLMLQEQNSLTGLLTNVAPPSPRGRYRR
jgi:hypothetical protein